MLFTSLVFSTYNFADKTKSRGGLRTKKCKQLVRLCALSKVFLEAVSVWTLKQKTVSVNWVELGVNASISLVSSNKAKETTVRTTTPREKMSLRGTQGWMNTSKHVMCLGFECIWWSLKTEIRKGTKFFLIRSSTQSPCQCSYPSPRYSLQG